MTTAENAPAGHIRVVIVDDDPMVGAFLQTLLTSADDIEIVARALDGAAGVEDTIRHRPDVVLMDLRMPGVDGIAATREIVNGSGPPRVLVMTTFNSDEQVLAALQAGASGYLIKTATEEQLIHTIRVVAAGGSVLSPETLARLVESATPPAATEQNSPSVDPDLTEREREVLHLVAEGATNGDIADRLYLSEATIKGYVSRLMTKCQCTNRTQLALRVQQRNR